jgi:hypothetical protein
LFSDTLIHLPIPAQRYGDSVYICTYTDTLKSSRGCDSIIRVVNLSVFSPAFANATASICSGQTYRLPSGRIVSTAGIYRDTLRAAAGCDSIISTIDLRVLSTSIANANAFICAGGRYILPSEKLSAVPEFIATRCVMPRLR